ncbi:MAG: ABC transporter ATP-binding protein [Lachnospiraceae bacterium]|nr:ABC transporter ATP-binding protein [Lachnospiraceae bacterium]
MGKITLETKDLKKVYVDTAGNRNTVFENLFLRFESGKMYAIFGPSGCGKSTLLNLLGLLDKPNFGQVIIGGKMTGLLAPNDMAGLRRDYIGFVFQDHYMNPKLNVKENLEMPMRINKKIKKSEYESRCRELLALFGMEEYLFRYPDELSGGEQQRACIARALVNDPMVILADEPTGNLDEDNEKIVAEYLKSLTARDKTVIVVTHNEAVRAYADVVYNMRKGKMEEFFQINMK